MVLSANLGFPRIGAKRELKKALESYWAKEISREELSRVCRQLREINWKMQHEAEIDHIPSNDFVRYDHVLSTIGMVDAIPDRYRNLGLDETVDIFFAMARGTADVGAMEMTKWFDTNYHYIVPEFHAGQKFRLNCTKAYDHFLEARHLGIETRPVFLGPVSFLLLGKMKDGGSALSLLEGILPIYEDILGKLASVGAEWVQLDEPCFALDRTDKERAALKTAYTRLAKVSPRLKLLVATYFDDVGENMESLFSLPVHGIHLDLVRAPQQLERALKVIRHEQTLSLGVIDGRNIWRADLSNLLPTVTKAVEALGSSRVMVAPSCSLLHSPVDLEGEKELDVEIKSWMAFARQKLFEVSALAKAASQRKGSVMDTFDESDRAAASRKTSARIHNTTIQQRAAAVDGSMLVRTSPYPKRAEAQHKQLHLPLFPTTTIGSFPQTSEIRTARSDYKAKRISPAKYTDFLKEEIAMCVRIQEEIGLDVLVHGEAERNDMVEYFGENLNGFTFTKNGWVQSYGSRCVKPPVIFGDVSRPAPMTVEWSTYAQSLTKKPMKGMLTGPVTILQWSFVRNDQPRSETAKQIALALRDEVLDLEKAGIKVIQIDEPAVREGLPLRRKDWKNYLRWAVDAFRLSAAGVKDETQIHTHMCYAEFNDIIEAVAEMDADVISIETSRSHMELLDAFVNFKYPNEIGPGVYDIHSPRVVPQAEMEALLKKAVSVLRAQQIWVNPDCGLKTRKWEETKACLKNLVGAAKAMRGLAEAAE